LTRRIANALLVSVAVNVFRVIGAVVLPVVGVTRTPAALALALVIAIVVIGSALLSLPQPAAF
jgi:hypothetical protein